MYPGTKLAAFVALALVAGTPGAHAINLVCKPMSAGVANNQLAGPWDLEIPNLATCRAHVSNKGAIVSSTCVSSGGAAVTVTGSFTVAANCVVGGNLLYTGTANLTVKGTLRQATSNAVVSSAMGQLDHVEGAANLSFFMMQTK
jgi:hypothetical protein